MGDGAISGNGLVEQTQSSMSGRIQPPRAPGQLVWSPADPSLGVGLVTGVAGTAVRVRFFRLQEERAYTTRGNEAVILRYAIAHGERVHERKGGEVRVSALADEDAEGLRSYDLDDGRRVPESDLVPDIRDIGAKQRLATFHLVHPELVRARLRGLRLARVGQRPGFAAILGSRVEWLPHQIDVAARAIDSDPVRLLLADEVGLGKTVEAALIYAGLRHEDRVRRVLVLTPDALCIQWLGELYRKAHELLVLLDERRIEDARIDFPDLNPFEAHQKVVASIDAIASDQTLASHAAAAQWDLVIVDEAHHLRWRHESGGNDRYRLVEALAGRSRHLLLLTATPMALDPTEYHALLRLLDQARFDDPSTFEAVASRVARIRDVGGQLAAAVEGSKPITKRLDQAASRVLADDPSDAKRWERLKGLKPSSKTRAELAEQVLSALRERHGLADHVVRNRRGPVGGLPERRPETFMLEPPEPQELLIEVGEGVVLDLMGSFEASRERNLMLGQFLRALWAAPRALTDILMPVSPALVKELAPLILDVVDAPRDSDGLPTGDARLRWLVQRLAGLEPGEKLLVFAESAVAVRRLKEALDGTVGGDMAVFHRELAPRDQDRQVAWFRDPAGPSLMLSTESGGEGRNFQFCHQVVLYDLPWRPATTEQRIGRVDRVGQREDVRVLVPCFKGGYEAAILKIMQDSIGVLDCTVGGIDHSLEYVSDRLAELIVTRSGSDDWKKLYLETSKLVQDSRKRIKDEADPILDHASFAPERVKGLMQSVPADLEARTEAFVHGFADASRLAFRSRGAHIYAVEGAPSAAGGADKEAGFVATFSRTHALDHEDVEFLSIGHPLVNHALDWAKESSDASAALALCRGFPKDGAVFLWHYELDLPDDVPEAAAYFDATAYTFALDEAGNRVEELEGLIDSSRRLDRMDAAPLKQNARRWQRLVEENFAAGEAMVDAAADEALVRARKRLKARFLDRRKHRKRSQQRELAGLGRRASGREALAAAHTEALERLEAERERISCAIDFARPRLLAAVAVRLMRATEVSV